MAISSKDIETLWKRYQEDGSKRGISVAKFFESNGVPYHTFEKWYKKKFAQPDVVDCVVKETPEVVTRVVRDEDVAENAAGIENDETKNISYVYVGFTDGMKIEHHKLRGGYDKLSGVVRTLTGRMEEGTAYIFTSKDQKLVKIIRHEHNECQLYVQRFDHNMSFLSAEGGTFLSDTGGTFIPILSHYDY